MSARRVDLRLMAVVLAIGLAAGCAGKAVASKDAPTRSAASTSSSRTITTSATGVAKGVPDNLQADVAVHTQGPTAAQVLGDNNNRTKGLIDLLGAAGVSPKDVQTTSVSLGPTFDNKGRITGYAADNAVKVTLRDLRTAGAKLDALTARVGDAVRIGGISLGFNDDDTLKSAARTDAVRRARRQAEEMAKAAGTSLGRVRTITEQVPDALMGGSALSAKRVADASVQIAPGQSELNVQVKVVFELS